MGPKTFVACYVCLKEFGSRSIPFHEPKCLERWRASNKNLPAEKRTPTPVKPISWKHGQDDSWVCSHCQVSVPAARRDEHVSVCISRKPRSATLGNKNGPTLEIEMTGVVKTDISSPKKGKENKNISNHIPISSVNRKNAKAEAKDKKEPQSKEHGEKASVLDEPNKVGTQGSENVNKEEDDEVSSTSRRSIRPQTKILRRPTPNLNHPVIQVDSDDSSGGDSSSSDKAKEENPKRLKMGIEVPELSSHKRKNFIMYNKYNVEKNTKNVPKERTSATLSSGIPNPCNSCNRSQAPERLHSHAKRDARGLMFRKSPSLDVKMSSPQKKVSDTSVREKVKNKESKNIPTHECSRKDKEEIPSKENCAAVDEEDYGIQSDNATNDEPHNPEKELLEMVKSCYICQNEFKASSLLLHESKCLEDWKKSNNSLTPNRRQLPPRRPEENLIADEDDPAWAAVQSQLVPCSLCGRTFFPERLPIHRRVCKGKPSPRPLKRASSLREQSASSRDGEEERPAPLYLPCYICGRSYGSWVIPMHEQQCLKKWRRENEKLPNDEQQEEPQKSESFATDDEVASLVELGDNAWESHLQQLVPCPRCSRTFFPDRLGIHERSCKGPSCSRRPRSNKGA